MRGLAVGIVVLVVIAMVAAVWAGLLAVAVNTTTQTHKNAGWRGGGQFAGDGSDNPGNELLNDDEYIASWSPDLNGQVATAGLHIGKEDIVGCSPDSARYDWYINSGGGWGNPVLVTDVGPGGIVFVLQTSADVKSTTYTIRGLTHGGGVRVIAYIHCSLGSWVPMAQDEARVLSGIGDVAWGQAQYTVGDTASVTARVPYITDDTTGRGWLVTVYSTAQNRIVATVRVIQLVQRIDYRVTTQDFTVSAGCRNELVAILTNELWDKDFDTSTVIDVSGAGPTARITGFLPLKPEQGDTLIVKFEATPNPDTDLSLTKLIIKWGFGGTEQEKELPPTATEQQIPLGASGTLHVEVIAYDSGCRPSPTAELDVQVGEPPIERIPGVPLVLILAVAASVVAAFLIWRYVPIPNITARAILAASPVFAVVVLWAVGVL